MGKLRVAIFGAKDTTEARGFVYSIGQGRNPCIGYRKRIHIEGADMGRGSMHRRFEKSIEVVTMFATTSLRCRFEINDHNVRLRRNVSLSCFRTPLGCRIQGVRHVGVLLHPFAMKFKYRLIVLTAQKVDDKDREVLDSGLFTPE